MCPRSLSHVLYTSKSWIMDKIDAWQQLFSCFENFGLVRSENSRVKWYLKLRKLAFWMCVDFWRCPDSGKVDFWMCRKELMIDMQIILKHINVHGSLSFLQYWFNWSLLTRMVSQVLSKCYKRTIPTISVCLPWNIPRKACQEVQGRLQPAISQLDVHFS